jgi:hypothetical protein
MRMLSKFIRKEKNNTRKQFRIYLFTYSKVVITLGPIHFYSFPLFDMKAEEEEEEEEELHFPSLQFHPNLLTNDADKDANRPEKEIPPKKISLIRTRSVETDNESSSSEDDDDKEEEEKEDEEDCEYPAMDDPYFSFKIASLPTFEDTKYNYKIYQNIEKYANQLSKKPCKIQPHQEFVEKYLSDKTPYNGLILYHGVGTGKTFSGLAVCENYRRSPHAKKPIIIVALRDILDSFRKELFDPSLLTKDKKTQEWTFGNNSCLGDSLIHEVTHHRKIPLEDLVQGVQNIVDKNYRFMTYHEFANYLYRRMGRGKGDFDPAKFNGMMIVIDEVHNIRTTSDDEDNRKVAVNLDILMRRARNLRLVLLSATPMYNSHKEIVWLLNLLHANDGKAPIEIKDVFTAQGDFVPGGEDLLREKVRGYISFVRGENPYTFPYRIYPNLFAPNHTFEQIMYPSYQYDHVCIPDKNQLRKLQVYLTRIPDCGKTSSCEKGGCQLCIYRYLVSCLLKKKKKAALPTIDNLDNGGYDELVACLSGLTMSYPHERLASVVSRMHSSETPKQCKRATPITSSRLDSLDEAVERKVKGAKKALEVDVQDVEEEKEEDPRTTGGGRWSTSTYSISPNTLVGTLGLKRMMKYVDNAKQKGFFEYKESTLAKYGRIFAPGKVGHYSAKIRAVLKSIVNPTTKQVSEGYILIFSQFVDGGLLPMALALEEMGMTRYSGGKGANLFASPISTGLLRGYTYSLITGDSRLSPSNVAEIDAVNNKDATLKVVLVSLTGSEGLNFKGLRQVHILDPLYSMSGMEQIIGRAVRTFSHMSLPYAERNVMIFMHGSILGEKDQEEAMDLLVYRAAEKKAVQIGKISRILKETSVDCVLHHTQNQFTVDKLSESLKKHPVKQVLSNGFVIHKYEVGDKPNTNMCDFMDTCKYTCAPPVPPKEDATTSSDTDTSICIQRKRKEEAEEEEEERDLFVPKIVAEAQCSSQMSIIRKHIQETIRDYYFVERKALLDSLSEYPTICVIAAVKSLIDKSVEMEDRYGNIGTLKKVGNYYLFQPTLV